ncbi:MAG TPA: methylenetetrahydrofolate--tRNA-(uracil(54)-C(5))-methyltransferase (FADH(2)-oxidizing) TrmFO [Candidatus Avidehalobacter gallistercoris]|mgnify:CR=1 FL=1|uniref:Methylenetetrahydrofolate--tRNA-(uracil-5-)-methyltransferase TrmFO n=1 Tax=Candidatus Avidehalobacter gallistercoris TaxID=2840694 RepID=A0A9D1HIM2_9FIRM|nr:methylenetetrahydrofolate--tRNA-(uracil(54)-C(5))-methyltransferase (FADH(2)-oxidizing) TrmFO [Candidatus Avidehalobacter gallistercoris]
MKQIKIIGAGLAGSEAAWQAAAQGAEVTLYEMRPERRSPAHHTADFAELVCSNSLRAAGLTNAVGLLKEEMRRQGSLIMRCADATRVPAGGALAVDRESFARQVTESIESCPNITVRREEITSLNGLLDDDSLVIVAAGPLISDALAADLQRRLGVSYLHFHDAVAPIVDGTTVDMTKAYWGSRYGKGESERGDYLNCPMTKNEYLRFYQELIAAERAPLHHFESEKDFEGCMPIESMARRGEDTIRFGPMKPVGLPDPHNEGREAYAVVQLRQDNAAASMFNLVGFQTRLLWGEQQRVFRLIPGLENAEFLRFGVMHRNTFLNAPQLLNADLSLQSDRRLYFAGQITGVEGYVESAACGLAAGFNAARRAKGEEPFFWPRETALGGLLAHLQTPSVDFQPMNVTFGLIEPLGYKLRSKQQKNLKIAERALNWLQANSPLYQVEAVGDSLDKLSE